MSYIDQNIYEEENESEDIDTEHNENEYGIIQPTDEEHFLMTISKNNENSEKTVVLHNTRTDYQFRPENATLNQTCLYEFIANYEIEKTKNKNDNPDLKRILPLLERFQLHPKHPLGTSHVLKTRSYKTPVLIGPQIPNKNRIESKERYSRAILTLFYPWRHIDDLINSNQNWESALEEKSDQIPINLREKIENIQLLHESKLVSDDLIKQKMLSDITSLTLKDKIERMQLHENFNENEDYEDIFVDYLNNNTIVDDQYNSKNKLNQYILDANTAAAKVQKFKLSKSKSIEILLHRLLIIKLFACFYGAQPYSNTHKIKHNFLKFQNTHI